MLGPDDNRLYAFYSSMRERPQQWTVLPEAIDSCGEGLVLKAALCKHEVAGRCEWNLNTTTLRKG
eukprot:COSAG02_NODE_682_length_18523_cov_28.592271_7_plen_65_part_00